MNSSKKTVLVSLSGILNLISSTFFLFITSRLILVYLGSDYNGINSTINQIVSVLSIAEAGFTTASVVSLFKPCIDNDKNKIEIILSTTRYAFHMIGSITFLLGIGLAFLYSLIVKSGIEANTLFILFMMSVVSTSFNFFFTIKYQLLFQATQSEYYINALIFLSNLIFQSINIYIIIYSKNIIFIRFIYMLQIIFQGILIRLMFKKKYPSYSYKLNKDFSSIKGTKDVFIGKITSVLYNSSSVFFISTFINTVYVSVFSVYNLPITFIKNIMYTIINSPQNALGRLNSSEGKKVLQEVFVNYEFLVIVLTSLVLSTLASLIIPFVKIYTFGVNDVNYINSTLAIIMLTNTYFELVHIPSGILINMSGNFKVAKNIQLKACIVLLTLSIFGSIYFSLNGLLLAVLITSIILAFNEIYYIKMRFFSTSHFPVWSKIIINYLILLLNLIIMNEYFSNVDYSFLQLVVLGFISIFVNALLIIMINFMLFKEDFLNLIHIVVLKMRLIRNK